MGKGVFTSDGFIGEIGLSSVSINSFMRMCRIVGLWMLSIPALLAHDLYPLPTERQASQFRHLLSELRCLVCQNQDLADSNAGLANDLRMEVYNRVKNGQSDREIIDYLTERYGDFILFNPPLKSITAMLWVAPIIFLSLGIFIFWRKFQPSK